MKFTPEDNECDLGRVIEIILARTRVSGSVSGDVVGSYGALGWLWHGG